MDTTEVNIWEHYGKQPESRGTLVERLKDCGPQQDENGIWMGKFPSWQDAHIAADTIQYLERRVTEYEDTIRYLTLQLGKTL
jgi:hypothetical protein